MLTRNECREEEGGIGASKTNPIVSFQKIWEYRVLDRRRRRRRRRGWGEREWKEMGNCYVSRDSGSTRTHRPYIESAAPNVLCVCEFFLLLFLSPPAYPLPFFYALSVYRRRVLYMCIDSVILSCVYAAISKLLSSLSSPPSCSLFMFQNVSSKGTDLH